MEPWRDIGKERESGLMSKRERVQARKRDWADEQERERQREKTKKIV